MQARNLQHEFSVAFIHVAEDPTLLPLPRVPYEDMKVILVDTPFDDNGKIIRGIQVIAGEKLSDTSSERIKVGWVREFDKEQIIRYFNHKTTKKITGVVQSATPFKWYGKICYNGILRCKVEASLFFEFKLKFAQLRSSELEYDYCLTW